MIKDHQGLTIKSQILLYALKSTEALNNLSSRGSLNRALNPELYKHYRKKSLDQAIKRMWQNGYLTYEYKESKKIIKLTKRGQLEALFEKSKAEVKNSKKWDGNWTIISFDVPEGARYIRTQLRALLKSFKFHLLQASVYISPHPFPDAGYQYLKTSGLDRYITIFSAHKISSTRNLKKIFKLNQHLHF